MVHFSDMAKINIKDGLWERGIERVYPSLTQLEEFIKNNKLKIFLGLDPTGDSLHIGHGSILLKLKKLQQAGHEIIILIGDFTAMIGDPTDKKTTRRQLTPVEVKENYKNYQAQIGKVLDLTKVTFKYNNDWLGQMTFKEVVELASDFTVGQMIERDMFQERIKNGEPIYLHEFLYPLMQGYDSVAMGVNAEIGASDQTFNMLMGRTMVKKTGQDKFVIATKLLVDPTGKKMGKTEGNMVTLEDTPADMYGKVMSWPDSLMPLAFEICTEVTSVEIEKILAGNPRDAKMTLAKEIVKTFIGADEAKQAEMDFIQKFQTKEIPDELTVLKVTVGDLLIDVLLNNKIITSKSAYKRLLDGGAVYVWPDQKIDSLDYKINSSFVLKLGKKQFFRIDLD